MAPPLRAQVGWAAQPENRLGDRFGWMQLRDTLLPHVSKLVWQATPGTAAVLERAATLPLVKRPLAARARVGPRGRWRPMERCSGKPCPKSAAASPTRRAVDTSRVPTATTPRRLSTATRAAVRHPAPPRARVSAEPTSRRPPCPDSAPRHKYNTPSPRGRFQLRHRARLRAATRTL